MKKNYLFLFLLFVGMMTSLTSCLNSGENENTNDGYLTAYVTITGTYPSYVLLIDGGGEMTLTFESMNNATNNKGFGENKRAFFQIGYKNENITYKDGNKQYPIIRDAELVDGSYIPTSIGMEKNTAVMRNLCVPDSIDAIEKLGQAWYANGYMNVVYNAPYSITAKGSIFPSMNLMYDQDEMDTDLLKVVLLYNRHTGDDARIGGYLDLSNSFDISNILRQVPGTGDSIQVEVSVEKDIKTKFKVKR